MKSNKFYIEHILEAIGKIECYLKDQTFESFSKNDMVIDAAIRELEIIGEAATNVSEDYQEEHSNVPWDKMISMRNRLIHEYFGVNKKIVWDTCEVDLKELKNLIKPLV